MPDAVSQAHPRHAVGLREGPGHDHARVLERRRDLRLVRGVGHVVVVRLVEQDRGVGRGGQHAVDEGAHRGRGVQGGGGVVGVVQENDSRALAGLRHGVQVELQRRVEGDRAHRGADQLGVARALLVGQLAGHQRPGRRGEHLHGRAQDLGRPAAGDDVLRLGPELLGEGLLQVLQPIEHVAPRRPTLAERLPQGVEGGRSRPQGVLVVVEQQRPRGGARGRALDEARPGVASGGEDGGPAEAEGLDHRTACERHRCLPAHRARAHFCALPRIEVKTWFARFISSRVPRETRA